MTWKALLALLPSGLRDPVAGDLEEEYAAVRARRGRLHAEAWAWWTAARLAARFRWERAARGRPLPPIGEELRRSAMWDSLRQDVAFGARMLWRQPGFTVVAVLALALGIGANTAIFSVVDGVLWRPLPYADSSRVVSIAEQRPREGRLHGPVAPADFYDWRRDNRSFSAMAAVDPTPVNLTGVGEPERLRAIAVTPGFLDALGIAPALGRDFRADEETPGRHRVVLLTDGLWRRHFGGDPAIVGRPVTLNGNPYDVVGVLPATFWWPTQAEILAPYPSVQGGDSTRSLHSMEVVARLKPGISLEQAQADMAAIGRQLSEQYPDSNRYHFPHVATLQESMVGDMRSALLLLLGAVALVLLIACANVATLLLARATGRQREIAVRLAIGAGRSRLVRQMLTESVLLALVGGATGLLVAGWSISVFRALLPTQFLGVPGLAHVGIDARILTVAGLVSAATGIVFGVIPALTASSQAPGALLNEEGRGGGSGARGWRVRASLVVVEMALSIVLLVGAALLLVSFRHLLNVPTGFNAAHVATAPLALPANRYNDHAKIAAFYGTLLEKVRALPGVEAADVVTALPFSGADSRAGFQIENRTGESPVPVRAHPRLISPGYLRTLGVPLVRGRFFSERDAEGSTDVAIINAAGARRYWPNEDPIGRRVSFAFGEEPRWIEIVGVAGDIKHASLDADSEPEMYLPYLQTNFATMARGMTVVIRTQAPAADVAPLLKAAISEIDRNQPLGVVSQMDKLIAGSVAPRRLNLWIVSSFAVVALVLTGAGLYGVMAYLVAQRTHEIGVRIALGASRRQVLALVLRQVGTLTAIGIAVGVVVALAFTRWLASLLFGVSATDPLVYAVVSAILATVALAAVAVPSSRATAIDPLRALRQY
jgi:putative ABC transport system permease protein